MEADLEKATMGYTAVGNVDLSQTKGLETVGHEAPSTIGTDTLAKSQGKIPEAFLRGCGLQDWEIQVAKLYDPHLSRDERTQISYEIVNLQAESPIMLHHLGRTSPPPNLHRERSCGRFVCYSGKRTPIQSGIGPVAESFFEPRKDHSVELRQRRTLGETKWQQPMESSIRMAQN